MVAVAWLRSFQAFGRHATSTLTVAMCAPACRAHLRKSAKHLAFRNNIRPLVEHVPGIVCRQLIAKFAVGNFQDAWRGDFEASFGQLQALCCKSASQGTRSGHALGPHSSRTRGVLEAHFRGTRTHTNTCTQSLRFWLEHRGISPASLSATSRAVCAHFCRNSRLDWLLLTW